MTARRIIGALILILMGIPTLFGMIWAVGLVRASVSEKVLSDLPREIIAEIPRAADEIFAAAEDESWGGDEEARTWLKAAAETGISPRELMETTGILRWMESELSESLRRAGLMIRGEIPWRPISIDMRPLKGALLHPELDAFLSATLANLPPCDEEGVGIWMSVKNHPDLEGDLPACRPDLPLAKEILLLKKSRAVADMDDKVEIIDDVRSFPFRRFPLAKALAIGSYFLFLIPAAFIFIGSVIVSRSSSGRLLWSGASVLAGSLPVLILTLGIKAFIRWGSLDGGFFWWRQSWGSDVDRLVLDKLSWIPGRVADAFFSPVLWTAVAAAIAGVFLLALSFAGRSREPVQKAAAGLNPPG